MKLESDFRDYYDHMFSGRGPVFRRFMTEGPPKRQQFRLLSGLGCMVPKFGLVRDLQGIDEQPELVVYMDETAHCGDGKALMTARAARALCPDAFASCYVPQIEPLSTLHRGVVSRRYLQVGSRAWWLEYRSDDAWRSNVGDVSVIVLEETACLYGTLSPLFAIDYVPYPVDFALLSGWPVPLWGAKGGIAVDFNTAPGLSPLLGRLPAGEAVRLIETAAATMPGPLWLEGDCHVR